MTYKYRATWQQEDLMEFALSHTVRYRDPLNKKRFAIPYKDAQKAADKMAQLKRDGVKEIEITKDILRGKFKEADLTKGQIKKVHKMADELPKQDFKDRYGDKKGDAVRYATATNIVKKKEGIKEAMSPANINKLRDSWKDIKLMSPEKVKTLKNFLDKYSTAVSYTHLTLPTRS